MKIRWTEPAVADLEAIRDYIARDSGFYAAQFVERILQVIDTLVDFPLRGRKVPEAGRTDVRETILGAYRIMYRVEPETILILAIMHGARDLGRRKRKPWEE